MTTIDYQQWKIGDVVSPGEKKAAYYGASRKYDTLHYPSYYVVTDVNLSPSGRQSVKLRLHEKGSGYRDLDHNGEGRWYSSDGLNKPSSFYKGAHHVNIVTKAAAKNNLATEILGVDVNVSWPADGVKMSEAHIPTVIVVDLKTNQVVFAKNVGRTSAIPGDSTYDKTATTYDPNKFIGEQLRKDPTGAFAVYELSRVGRVSDIKVSWT